MRFKTSAFLMKLRLQRTVLKFSISFELKTQEIPKNESVF
jgi:hypothetical protein